VWILDILKALCLWVTIHGRTLLDGKARTSVEHLPTFRAANPAWRILFFTESEQPDAAQFFWFQPADHIDAKK